MEDGNKRRSGPEYGKSLYATATDLVGLSHGLQYSLNTGLHRPIEIGTEA